MEKTLRIKLFGESFKLHKLQIQQNDLGLFQSVANNLKQSLDEALLDIRFFEQLSHPEYLSINNLVIQSFGGLIKDHKNKIELSWGRRKIDKLNIQDLLQSETLFPLYQTKLFSADLNNISGGFYLVEREVGLVACYEILREDFRFDNLEFHVTKAYFQSTSFEILNKVEYKGRKFISFKKDCLLKYQLVYNIKP
ncbi:hypothetical protein LRR18_00825 [Mangrovimonas sp. AS39]|uniref:hypothetical protein n=1 Tax=Mangrovimonas futianensis TaxID=2895523 RepID=UPI001E52B470|nr:hypothetical protein [Mangrovimonas futianensis]MCF1190110.1 hypothetical protein [Mangrovimonas futianensis]MCF1194139.1 hypothetical protein [Mangrovimonas futianensis]